MTVGVSSLSITRKFALSPILVFLLFAIYGGLVAFSSLRATTLVDEARQLAEDAAVIRVAVFDLSTLHAASLNVTAMAQMSDQADTFGDTTALFDAFSETQMPRLAATVRSLRGDDSAKALDAELWGYLSSLQTSLALGPQAARIALMQSAEANRRYNSLRDTLDGYLGEAEASLASTTEMMAMVHRHHTYLSIASAGVVLVILAVFASYASGSLVRPIQALVARIDAISRGTLDVPVEEQGRRDEIGELARAAERLRIASIERLQLMEENARATMALAKEKLEAERLITQLAVKDEQIALHRKFVSMVSHEFRTPLTVIDGQAQAIKRRGARMTMEAVQARMVKISASVARLVDLIESILSSASLDAGALKVQPEPVALAPLIRDVCEQYREISTAHQITLDLDGLPPCYHADPKMIRHIVSNLVANAVKYSPGKSEVAVQGHLKGGMVVFAVRDWGVGIPAEEVPKLTNAYFRASTAARIPGTGLGLNLVRAFAEMHDGALKVHSEVGVGSTFSVHFPYPGRFAEDEDDAEVRDERAPGVDAPSQTGRDDDGPWVSVSSA